MIDFGKNAVYIWASYGVSFVALAGLAIWTLRKPRK